MELKRILLVVYIILNVYVFSVGTLQGLLNYQAWTLIGDLEFPSLHQAVSEQTLKLFLPFLLLSIPFNFVMIWLRLPVISKRIVVLVAVLNLAIFIATMVLIIPIQNQLDQHKSVELIAKLVQYHLYFRALPGMVVLLAIFTMLFQIVRKISVPSV